MTPNKRQHNFYILGTSLIHIRLTKNIKLPQGFSCLIYYVATITALSTPTSKPIAYITTKDIIYLDDKYCVPWQDHNPPNFIAPYPQLGVIYDCHCLIKKETKPGLNKGRFHPPSILDVLQQLCFRKACTTPKGVPPMLLAQHLGNGG